jgi:hypothetical protein
VKECGARVIVAEIEGERVSLNPVWTSVAVPEAGGRFTMVRGLQPHVQTCVDIAGRRQAEGRMSNPALH